MKKKKITSEDVKSRLLKRKPKKIVSEMDFFSTGSTLLNLACTGNPNRGYAKGKYYIIVGPSQSAKTVLVMTAAAEICNNPNFDNFDIIYDGPERGALMDIGKMFGAKLSQRIRPPATKDGFPVPSVTIEDFYYNLHDAISGDKPCLYVLDSMDALYSQAEEKIFLANKKTKTKKKKEEEETEEAPKKKGSYGDGKAKINSQFLRMLLDNLDKSGSILLIIAQEKDAFKTSFFGPDKTYAGGHTLKFYASLQIWTDVVSGIRVKNASTKGLSIQIGTTVRFKVDKNRFEGKKRSVKVDVYDGLGIDDIGSCVEWLLAIKHWTKNKGVINAHDMELSGTKEKLIQLIEEQDREKELKDIVSEVWNEIEEACSIKRKKRYE